MSGVIAVHSNTEFHKDNGNIQRLMENIRISGPAEEFHINFDYDPQSAYTDRNGVTHNEPNFTKIPSAKTLIGPIAHIHYFITARYIFICSFSPNEQNGNFLLYPKLKSYLWLCAIFFVGIAGGLMIGRAQSLFSFYIGFFGTSIN